MKDIITNIILGIVIAFFVFIILKEFFLDLYEYRKCSRCNSSFFKTRITKTESLGIDFEDSDKENIRHYFNCKKCNHTWTVDTYNDLSSSD
ncbi:hypothetical protein [Aquimarina rubra]|uniref:Uncharacterized protein n=1 Tax=Aquimarina rubra TaxID=1920033 RepID=A0ABW5LB75_9FLAO